MQHTSSTICAIATAPGGAIGIVRISGPSAIALTETLFRPQQGAPLRERKSHSLTFGTLVAPDGSLIDEVLVSLFRPPHSYTGEELVEISCHGSQYILQTVLRLLIDAGAVPAAPGEFTQRAFLNGRMDLSQAEAVADVIASTTASNHRIAMSQMRGDFSRELEQLRERLLHLTALLELELDFSDHEDLEFADRTELAHLAEDLEQMVARLVHSFATGNALKNGLPVAIVGSTNSGKSTLLNALLHDERAIVSDIHGTTRDVIEDTYNLGGTLFRFIDTAGLRTTTDTVEQMGIERSWQKLSEAQIVLFVVDRPKRNSPRWRPKSSAMPGAKRSLSSSTSPTSWPWTSKPSRRSICKKRLLLSFLLTRWASLLMRPLLQTSTPWQAAPTLRPTSSASQPCLSRWRPPAPPMPVPWW